MDTRLLAPILWLAATLGIASPAAAQQAGLPYWQSSQWYRNGATLDLDFLHDKYWINGTSYSGIANFFSGVGATFTRSGTAATYFDSSGTLQVATANTPRLDYGLTGGSYPRGVMIEQSRRNYIRNNAMVGATATTVPTNWTAGGGNGITISVVGTGTDGGINYLDLRVSGTATALTAPVLFFDTATGIAATTANILTESLYIKSVTGSAPLGATVGWYNYDATPAFLASQQVLNNASYTSSWTRLVATATPTSGTTATVRPYIFTAVSNGAVVDFTYRVGMPQLERGASPTSVIPTSGSAVTRSADLFLLPTTASGASGVWYTAGQGTLAGTAIADYAQIDQIEGIVALNDATANNSIHLFFNTAGAPKAEIYNSGSGVYGTVGSCTLGTVCKDVIAFSGASTNSAIGGTLLGSSTPAIPTVTQLKVGELRFTNGPGNVWVNRIWYMPTREPDAALADYTR